MMETRGSEGDLLMSEIQKDHAFPFKFTNQISKACDRSKTFLSTTPRCSSNMSKKIFIIQRHSSRQARILTPNERTMIVTQFSKSYFYYLILQVFSFSFSQQIYKSKLHLFVRLLQTIKLSYFAQFSYTCQSSFRFHVFAHFKTQTFQDCFIFMAFSDIDRKPLFHSSSTYHNINQLIFNMLPTFGTFGKFPIHTKVVLVVIDEGIL